MNIPEFKAWFRDSKVIDEKGNPRVVYHFSDDQGLAYFGEPNPSEDTIIDQIVTWGLCHWRQVELIDSIDCSSVWRFAFSVVKVKATDYTAVRNR